MINVRLALRPIRVGFIVKQGDFDALWKAVRFNTCLWGGRFNPIIPVREADLLSQAQRSVFDPPLADYLVRTFDVDLLEQLSDDASCTAFVEARGHLRRHLHDLVSDEGTPHQHLSLLDVLPVIRGWGTLGSGAARLSASAPPVGGWRANLVRIMGGDPDGTELGSTTLRSHYRQLHPAGHIINDRVPLPTDLVTNLWPIDLSGMNLQMFRPPSAWSNPGVVVGDAMDFDDLVSFWNLRAAGNAVILMPAQAADNALPLARAHLEIVGPGRPDDLNSPTVWNPRGKHDAVVAVVKNALGIGEQPFDGGIWNGLNVKPVRVARDWITTMAHLRDDTKSAWLRAQVPQAFDRSHLDKWNRLQVLVLDVSVEDFTFGGERVTLRVPQLQRMNGFLDQMDRGIRVKRDGGISFFTFAENSVIDLSPVTFESVMKEVLSHCGFEIKDSIAGKFCRRTLELMGGVGGCRVFKVPGVRKLLREKAAQTGIGGPNAQQVIADRDSATKKPSFSDLTIFLDGERCTEQVALRHLVRKGVLRPGAALECPKCGEQSWYPMTRMRPRVKCDCCGATSDTAVRLGTRVDIKFKVAPLWRKVDVQFGVIPVILSLWRLTESRLWNDGRYLTSAELKGHGITMEVDFLGLVEERDEEPMVLVGECKGTRERDSEKMRAKVEKLKMWYDAVETAGLRACIAFATTEREFDTDLLAECEAMVGAKRRVLLLGARELDPYDPQREPDVPRRYSLSTVEGLRVNGMARYLPEFWKRRQDELPKTKYTRVKQEDGDT